MTIQLSVMTPEQVFWNEPVEEVILPTNSGQMGVLSSHADLITAIDIGVMSIRYKGVWRAVALANGFAAVRNDRVTVLVNSAEAKDSIEKEQAEKEFDEALILIRNANDKKSRIEANLTFKRARARFLVATD